MQAPIVHFFSSVAYVWVPGAKNYWADREKVWFFLNRIFSPVRNFKFGHMFCRNKKSCSVKSRFPVHLLQILDNIGSLPFISWAISMKLSDYYFFMPSTDVPSFVEKNPKIKYAISDRPHWRKLDVCETYCLLLNGSH
jgi:hypothetical protein